VSRHEHSDDTAAYALGALEPAETEAFRDHLRDCVVCRDEAAAFRDAVDALVASAPQYRASKELRRRVIEAVREDASKRAPTVNRARVRRARWRPAAASSLATLATAAVIAVAVLVGVELTSGGSETPRTVAASVGHAEVRLTGGRAELIVHHLPVPPPGQIYELWIRRGTRPPEPTNTLFTVTARGTAEIGVPGSAEGVTAILVTAEPTGGTQVPTTTPVVLARVT
jgi:anti-sigma-K factor RskA